MTYYITLYNDLYHAFSLTPPLSEHYAKGTRFFKCTEYTTVADLLEWIKGDYESTVEIKEIEL